jgi:hypothetical protein
MTSKGAADTQTASTAVPAGNTNFVAASGNIASGTASSFAGPWYVETQTLNIDYVRVPMEQYWNNTCNATLSGLATTHSNIQSTKLVFTYNASYDAAVVYQNFNTSSVQQAQEFTVIAASGDPNGVSYGNINASTLGPMGSIVTTKPFIRRVPYTSGTSATQPLVSKTSNGAQFAIFEERLNFSGLGLVSSVDVKDGTSFFTDLNYWSQYGGQGLGGILGGGTAGIIGNASQRNQKYVENGVFYSIPGAYDTSKELLPLDTVIDQIAQYITNEFLFAWPTSNTRSDGMPVNDEGLPEYDRNRHA